MWGALVVEVYIKNFIELWEQRNEEVHGKTEAQRQNRRLEKLCTEVRHLHTMRHLTRPSDGFIFHDDVDQFLEKATATTNGLLNTHHKSSGETSDHEYKEYT